MRDARPGRVVRRDICVWREKLLTGLRGWTGGSDMLASVIGAALNCCILSYLGLYSSGKLCPNEAFRRRRMPPTSSKNGHFQGLRANVSLLGVLMYDDVGRCKFVPGCFPLFPKKASDFRLFY